LYFIVSSVRRAVASIPGVTYPDRRSFTQVED